MAQNKDYYEILGVSRDASSEDISKAYKKLALKWHPDRHVNDSEEKKKECEENFKEVSEAYSVLSDPQKKQQYDRFGTVGDQPGGFGAGGFDPFDIFRTQFGDNPFSSFFHHGFSGQTQREYIPKGQDIQMHVKYSMKDFYCGCTKTLKYKKKHRCQVCHGEGGTGVSTCPVCGGTGMETITQRTPFGIMSQSQPCSHCHGIGKTVQDICHHCNGTGFEVEETTIDVTLPAGCADGSRAVISGKGHESKDIRGTNGDFIVIVTFSDESGKWRVNGNDIIQQVDIDWADCMLGAEVNVTLPDGAKKTIKLKECTPDGKTYKLRGCGVKQHGLEVGSYFVEVHWKLPESLTKKERELITQLKQHKY